MSYYTDLGAAKVTIQRRDEKGKLVTVSSPTSTTTASGVRDKRTGMVAPVAPVAPEGGGMGKLVLFAGLGAAALVAVMLLKKKGKAQAAPSVALFAAPKVA